MEKVNTDLEKNGKVQTGMHTEGQKEVEWEIGGRKCSRRKWDFRSLDFTIEMRKKTCS